MVDLNSYLKDICPWGNFEQFTLNEKTTVKILTVNPNEEFSLQKHNQRKEFWKIISGSGSITIGEETKTVSIGDTFIIEPNTKHRASAYEIPLVILEISFGEFDENDIERFEDDYGRV